MSSMIMSLSSLAIMSWGVPALLSASCCATFCNSFHRNGLLHTAGRWDKHFSGTQDTHVLITRMIGGRGQNTALNIAFSLICSPERDFRICRERSMAEKKTMRDVSQEGALFILLLPHEQTWGWGVCLSIYTSCANLMFSCTVQCSSPLPLISNWPRNSVTHNKTSVTLS